MNPVLAKNLIDLGISFGVGMGLLYGAKWLYPHVETKVVDTVSTPAVRRARNALAMRAMKGSLSMQGVTNRVAQKIMAKE